MKLVLKAYVASKYQDPILDFFDSRGFYIASYCQGARHFIRVKEDSVVMRLFYIKESQKIFCGDMDWDMDPGLLADNLYKLLEDLTQEVSAGDLSKLPELADTYIAFEDLF